MLIGLGTWQLQRKAWKDQLIAKIAERVTAPPIWLARDGQSRTVVETDDLEYLHVAFKGRFHHDKERYLYAPARAGLGWHVYTPLEWAPAHFVWVNRGFVPDERKDPATRREGQLAGEVEITGLLRIRQAKGAFTPTNDVAGNLWYWPDVAAMHASAFAGTGTRAFPFTVDADAAAGAPGRLAARRRHPARPAQPPSRIRADVVRSGTDADRRFRSLRPRSAAVPGRGVARLFPARRA